MALLTPIYTGITPIEAIEDKIRTNQAAEGEISLDPGQPSFLDVFKSIAGTAVETNTQKAQDMVNVMLGETDDIEGIQTNIVKAQVATDILVTVKNSVVDAYNEIIKMSI